MRAPVDRGSILLLHFFRRFFDNDTLEVEGDTTTTIARALAVVIAPGLLVAFFLQNQYPQRLLWGRIEDQYFFVLESFVVMGVVTIFEWEMLFPDKIDFLVLTPLPLVRRQFMTCKALALVLFLILFLVGTNLLGAIVYPAICNDAVVRHVFAHTIAVTLSGTFSSCTILATVGLLRCCLSDRLFRLATPFAQAVLTAALVFFVIHYARYTDSLPGLLKSGSTIARWMPPLWFLALYDRLLYGSKAPAFASSLCSVACYACGGCFALVLLLYPLTWSRMHKMSMEGAVSPSSAPSGVLQWLIHSIVRRPAERAMFHFLGQTVRRIPRYQIYLAMYGGTGFSLAAACAFVLQSSPAQITPMASIFGMHAVIPLLMFWTTAGLYTAFGFPANLSARWIFRVSGADPRDLVTAAWRLMIAAATLVWAATLLSLSHLGWSKHAVAVQIAFGLCLGLLLTDAFFLARRVPLIQPRLPGRSNFVLFLTLYVGVLTPAIFCIVWSEIRIERSLWLLLPVLALTLVCHVWFRHVLRAPMEQEEQMEGYDGEFQLLNLS